MPKESKPRQPGTTNNFYMALALPFAIILVAILSVMLLVYVTWFEEDEDAETAKMKGV